MPWVNIFDLGVFTTDIQAATCGGTGNTLHINKLDDIEPYPPNTEIWVEDGRIHVRGEGGEGGYGPIDGFVITGLPDSVRGKQVRLAVEHVEINETKYNPFGSEKRSGFSAFSCYWSDDMEMYFSDYQRCFLGASDSYQTDGKSTVETEDAGDYLMITAIDTGDEQCVNFNEPEDGGVIRDGMVFGMWFGVGVQGGA